MVGEPTTPPLLYKEFFMGTRYAALWNYKTFTPFTSTTTPTKFNFWQNAQDGPACDASVTSDSITIKVPGVYLVMFSVSFMGTTGTTYFFEVYKNGVSSGSIRATADGLTGATETAVRS
jgi:hypothetical protein